MVSPLRRRLQRVERNMAAENARWLSWWPKGLTLAEAVIRLRQEEEKE